MLYTITLTNKKTGEEISRDYDLSKLIDSGQVENHITDMKFTLEDNEPKF
jgi:hypothetical protein